MGKEPVILLGEWVVYGEDGFYFCSDEKVSFKTKREAIDEVSLLRLDSRPTPKVKRWMSGWYEYYPKDVDTGEFADSFTIKRVTEENLADFKEMLQVQLDSDPLGEEYE